MAQRVKVPVAKPEHLNLISEIFCWNGRSTCYEFPFDSSHARAHAHTHTITVIIF